VLAVVLALLPAVSAGASGEPPFDWSMQERYGQTPDGTKLVP
jgi:hypothetical protein